MKMVSFSKFLEEEDTKAIKASGIDSKGLDNKITRDTLNAAIDRATDQKFLTPYIALGAIAKVCAYASIVLPQFTFMDLESGEVVFDLTAFGDIHSWNPNEQKPTIQWFLYFEYSRNEAGTYDVFAELVDSETLEELLGMDLDGDNEAGEDPEHVAKVKGIEESWDKEKYTDTKSPHHDLITKTFNAKAGTSKEYTGKDGTHFYQHHYAVDDKSPSKYDDFGYSKGNPETKKKIKDFTKAMEAQGYTHQAHNVNRGSTHSYFKSPKGWSQFQQAKSHLQVMTKHGNIKSISHHENMTDDGMKKKVDESYKFSKEQKREIYLSGTRGRKEGTNTAPDDPYKFAKTGVSNTEKKAEIKARREFSKGAPKPHLPEEAGINEALLEWNDKFTDQHLETLKKAFSKIKTVNPDSPTYTALIKKLDELPQSHLKQIAGAGIPFMSNLARNRIKKNLKEESGGSKTVHTILGSGKDHKKTTLTIPHPGGGLVHTPESITKAVKAHAKEHGLRFVSWHESEAERDQRFHGINEEPEQIQELKKKTLKSYLKGARSSYDSASDAQSRVSRSAAGYGGRPPASLSHEAERLMGTQSKRLRGMAMARKKLKEEPLTEKLTPSMGADKYVADFIHSDNPKFAGKSAKKRQEMGLAAFYAAKRKHKD